MKLTKDQVKYVEKNEFYLNLKGKTADFYLDLRKIRTKIQRSEKKA